MFTPAGDDKKAQPETDCAACCLLTCTVTGFVGSRQLLHDLPGKADVV